jgi:hypothetical protein
MIAAVARRALRARPLCFGTASPNGAALLTRRAAARGYLAAANPYDTVTAARAFAARPQGAAAAHTVRRAASLGLVAARPPLARPQLCATFATASGDDDDQNRSLDALGDDFFERSRLEDRGNQRATPAGDLQYAGERPGNWEELLAEAEASYPERAGPRRSKHLKREARSGVLRASTCGAYGWRPTPSTRRMLDSRLDCTQARRFKNIRRQHYQRKKQRIAAHERNMARRSRLAASRRGWDGPRLPNP